MTELALALALFLAAHSLPTPTGLRAAAVARLGRGRWIALYSVVSTVSLVWVVSAAIRAPQVALWTPTGWMAAAPVLAMAPACLLVAMAAARPNPWSVSFRGGAADMEAPGVLAVTRHPLLWAFFLWGTSHALANGDLAAVALFGGAALFALAGMTLLERRARRRGEPEWPRRAPRDRLASLWSLRCAAEAAAGLALYAALALAHLPVIGADPFLAFR
jgi:uncharacterized membrane protein